MRNAAKGKLFRSTRMIAPMFWCCPMIGAPALDTAVSSQAAQQTVTVCMEEGGGFGVAIQARFIASEMFASIGVNILWHQGRRACPAKAMVISLNTRSHSPTPPNLLPGALAYALPYQGAHIRVFYDRMENYGPDRVPRVLAHVLVHEITHLLQRVNQHSAVGVMKARWEKEDFNEMMCTGLPFTPEDVRLIQLGMKSRAGHLAPVMLTGRRQEIVD